MCGSRSFIVGSKTLYTFGGFDVFYVSRQAPYIYIAAWQIMHGSEQFFEKNNSPIATHPDADADLQSQTVRLAIIYIKCIIQTAYKRHKKGIKGYSPELQRKRADVLLKSQSPS